MEYLGSDVSTEELMHYGRKGMKWYQNIFSKGKGGLGRKKRGTDNADDSPDEKNKSSSSSSSAPKSVKDMSDVELVAATNRLRNEVEYNRQLRAYEQQLAEMNPQKVSRGKQFITDMWDKSISPALQESGKQLLKDTIVKAGKDILNLDEKKVETAYEKLKREAEEAKFEYEKKKYAKESTLVDDFYKNREEKAKEKDPKAKEKDPKVKDKPADTDSTTKTTETKNDKSESSQTSSAKTDKSESSSSSSEKVETVKATVKSDNRTVKEKWDSDKSPIINIVDDPLSSAHARTAASKGLSVTSDLLRTTGNLSVSNTQIQSLSDAGKGYINELRQWYSKAH